MKAGSRSGVVLVSLVAAAVACASAPTSRTPRTPVSDAPRAVPTQPPPAAERDAAPAADGIERDAGGSDATPTATARAPDPLDAHCRWVDVWHPSVKSVRPTVLKRLQVAEATDIQPRITCCKLTARDALCKVWKSAQFVGGAASGVNVLGVNHSEGEGTSVWLDQNLTVATHGSMSQPDAVILRLGLNVHESDVTIERVYGACPRKCGDKCRGAEKTAQEACAGVGRYRSFAGKWEREDATGP